MDDAVDKVVSLVKNSLLATATASYVVSVVSDSVNGSSNPAAVATTAEVSR